MLGQWIVEGVWIGVKVFVALATLAVLCGLSFSLASIAGRMMYATGDGTREGKHDIHRR